MVQKIERLRVKLETVFLSRATRHRRWRGPVAAADADHPDLRSANLLHLRSEIRSPTQPRTNFPTRSTAGTITSNAKRTVINYGVAIVVESGGDVVRQRGGGLKNR